MIAAKHFSFGELGQTGRVSLEFKLEDLWIGAFWKDQSRRDEFGDLCGRFDLWICLVPCLPIHLTLWW